jgi:lipid-A-disaccharide synthase
MTTPRLLVSSGEPSGELYAAQLVQHLRALEPGLEVFGLGGDRLRAEGATLVAHIRDLAVVGLYEVLKHLRHLRGVFRRVLDEVDRDPPRAAVLVDYPDFNLRLARELHRRGIPVVYFVSPQIWAWRKGRIRGIRETVAKMLVIFPFEEALYRDAGVPVTFVGHPLVDLVGPVEGRADFLRGLGVSPGQDVVAVLPGSRPQEIAHNLPGLAGAVALLHARRPDLQFLLPVAPSIDAAQLAPALRGLPVRLVADGARPVLAACRAAIVASGTATVEAALLGAPMVVVYRLSALTHFLGRRLIQVPHVAMVNLIAGRRAVPELIQGDFTPERVADEVMAILPDGPRRAAMLQDLEEVRTRLGPGGASRQAAGEVYAFLQGTTAGIHPKKA